MIIVWKNSLNLKSFLKHDVYYNSDGLDLLSELIVSKEVMKIDKKILQLMYLILLQMHILLIECY